MSDLKGSYTKPYRKKVFKIENLPELESMIVVIGEYQGIHSVSRKPMRAAAAHVYNLRDGKISRFRMFADTKPMWDAMS